VTVRRRWLKRWTREALLLDHPVPLAFEGIGRQRNARPASRVRLWKALQSTRTPRAQRQPRLFWFAFVRGAARRWPNLTAWLPLGARVRVDWSAFHQPYAAGRPSIALPTYPFERQRHWMVQKQGLPRPALQPAPADGHPLLGRRVRSALREVQFEADLSSDGVAYLRDHRVFETPILPAAAFFELGLAAGQAHFTSTSTSTSAAVSLQDVEIHEALVVEDQTSRAMQVILSPEPKATAAFRIFSIGQDGDDDWACTPADTFAPVQPPCHSITPRSKRSRRAARTSARPRSTTLCWPRTAWPSAAVCAACSTSGGARVRPWAKIQLPEPQQSESQRFQLHPALLDACIQPLAAALPAWAQTRTCR